MLGPLEGRGPNVSSCPCSGLGSPESPKPILQPFLRVLPKPQKKRSTHRALCMTQIYIYNHSDFIVLYPLFTVDLTQALNNRRGRPLGRRKSRKTWAPNWKRHRSSGREKGRIPLGRDEGLQC